MGYSRAFGMRSFENIVRDARFRTPRTGDPFYIGTPVMLDAANPGFLTRPGLAQAPSPGCGLVIYEHIQVKGVDTSLTTVYDEPFNQVPLGQFAQMVHGPGVKVWFRNTDEKTLYDGRLQPGVTMYTGTPAVGDYLTPQADGTWGVGTAADGWLLVEHVNPTTNLVEARFTF